MDCNHTGISVMRLSQAEILEMNCPFTVRDLGRDAACRLVSKQAALTSGHRSLVR